MIQSGPSESTGPGRERHVGDQGEGAVSPRSYWLPPVLERRVGDAIARRQRAVERHALLPVREEQRQPARADRGRRSRPPPDATSAYACWARDSAVRSPSSSSSERRHARAAPARHSSRGPRRDPTRRPRTTRTLRRTSAAAGRRAPRAARGARARAGAPSRGSPACGCARPPASRSAARSGRRSPRPTRARPARSTRESAARRARWRCSTRCAWPRQARERCRWPAPRSSSDGASARSAGVKHDGEPAASRAVRRPGTASARAPARPAWPARPAARRASATLAYRDGAPPASTVASISAQRLPHGLNLFVAHALLPRLRSRPRAGR